MSATTLTVVPTTTVTSFDANQLKAAAAAIKPAIATKSQTTLAVLSHAKIEADLGVAILSATNLDVSLSAALDYDGDPITTLVPWETLNKAVMNFTAGTITVETAGSQVTLRHENLSLECETMPVAEMPVFPLKGKGREVTLNLDAIGDVLSSASDDKSRPILCSVAVQHGTYVTTDSYRLSAVETGVDTGKNFLIPAQSAAIAAKAGGCAEATVYGDRTITVPLSDSVTMTSRLVNGEFVNWRMLCPVHPEVLFTFGEKFHADLQKLIKLAPKHTGAPVKIVSGENGEGLILQITHDKIGGKAATAGESFIEVAYTPQYLLSTVEGTTSGTVYGPDNLKPGQIREPVPQFGEGATRLRLIMPVRVT